MISRPLGAWRMRSAILDEHEGETECEQGGEDRHEAVCILGDRERERCAGGDQDQRDADASSTREIVAKQHRKQLHHGGGDAERKEH